MTDRGDSNRRFWFPDEDKIPKDLRDRLFDSATRNWARIVRYTRQNLGDAVEPADIVASVVSSTARAYEKKPIVNLDSYIFSGVIRRVKKLLGKRDALAHADIEDLGSLEAAQDKTWVEDLEKHILVQELLQYMDEPARHIFTLWSDGFRLPEIAKMMGISEDNARMIVNRGFARARKRILGDKGSHS
jgi:RNA polymerase sigma factor (sigma-70 family)